MEAGPRDRGQGRDLLHEVKEGHREDGDLPAQGQLLPDGQDDEQPGEGPDCPGLIIELLTFKSNVIIQH